jgi:hypothetical protein
MTDAEDDVLELYIARDGRYEGANELALQVFDYSLDEIRRIRVGTLSNTPPDVADEAWRRFVESDTAVAAGGRTDMITKDGQRVTMEFLGTERGGPYAGYVSRSRLAAGIGANLAGPWRRRALLAHWRLAERNLSEMAGDDPDRPAAEAAVDECRRR